MYQGWQLAMIDEAGYNGIREEHIEKLAQSLAASGLAHIGNAEFAYHCRKCGMDPNNFKQEDLDRLQERLNQF